MILRTPVIKIMNRAEVVYPRIGCLVTARLDKPTKFTPQIAYLW